MNSVRRWRGASVYSNDDFVCIQTKSGYGGISMIDPKGATHVLAKNATNEELGTALLDALSKARFVLPAPRQDAWIHPDTTFDLDLYDRLKGEERYRGWIEQLMARYGYKTRRSLFKNMANCGVKEIDGVITLMPMKHVKLEAWEGMGEESIINIPAGTEPSNVGISLRLAMGRCLNVV